MLIAGEYKKTGSGNVDSLLGMRGTDKEKDWADSINAKFGTQYSAQQVKSKVQSMQRAAKDFLNKNRATHSKKAYQVTGASTSVILRENPLLTQPPLSDSLQAEKPEWLDYYLNYC